MAVFPLYSKQQNSTKSGRKIYRHDVMPDGLRRQILSILKEIVGNESLFSETPANAIWRRIETVFCHEHGIEALLVESDGKTPRLSLFASSTVDQYFRIAQVPYCLDILQLAIAITKEVMEKSDASYKLHQNTTEEGIAEINHRFKEHGVGFQIVDGQILRIDSEVLFQEATLPALTLLREPYLAGANQEFLIAHQHFRHARYKECLNECLKAFESTMKAICHRRKWPFNQNDTAKALIKICEDNGLFPVFMTNHLTGLRMCLESGVPTARNKTSGHGQGITPIVVSEDFASYVLNLTAANILFLVRSAKKLK